MKTKFFRIEWEGDSILTEQDVKDALLKMYFLSKLQVHEISDKVFEEEKDWKKEYKKLYALTHPKPKKIEKLDWVGKAIFDGLTNAEHMYELKLKQDELIEVVNRL
jgi:hypothetical protein